MINRGKFAMGNMTFLFLTLEKKEKNLTIPSISFAEILINPQPLPHRCHRLLNSCCRQRCHRKLRQAERSHHGRLRPLPGARRHRHVSSHPRRRRQLQPTTAAAHGSNTHSAAAAFSTAAQFTQLYPSSSAAAAGDSHERICGRPHVSPPAASADRSAASSLTAAAPAAADRPAAISP